MRYRLTCADVMGILPSLPDGCVHGVLTDPPYALGSKGNKQAQKGFMGRTWDRPDLVFNPKLWAEIRRVVVPGGYVPVFGGSRTFHRLACAMEDGGLILHDTLIWLFGQGMPHGLNISCGIDKTAGVERPVVGSKLGMPGYSDKPEANPGGYMGIRYDPVKECQITVPTTELASRFDGYHSQLKPCFEAVILAQVPMDGSYTENAEKHGIAGLNIDGCRIPYQNSADTDSATPQGRCTSKETGAIGATPDAGRNLERIDFDRPELKGRFPGNVIFSHSPECTDDQCDAACAVRLLDEQVGVRTSGKAGKDGHRRNKPPGVGIYGGGKGKWVEEGSAGMLYGDTGSASRFFFCGKACPAERTAGLGVKTKHETVKPVTVVKWLAELICPPKGEPARLLVPFAGVGSEMLGALLAGWDQVIGIEQDPTYAQQAEARLKWWTETSAAIGSTDPAVILNHWRKQ